MEAMEAMNKAVVPMNGGDGSGYYSGGGGGYSGGGGGYRGDGGDVVVMKVTVALLVNVCVDIVNVVGRVVDEDQWFSWSIHEATTFQKLLTIMTLTMSTKTYVYFKRNLMYPLLSFHESLCISENLNNSDECPK
ncbi:hypothetical protein YC2023_040717 [Brassica napus]